MDDNIFINFDEDAIDHSLGVEFTDSHKLVSKPKSKIYIPQPSPNKIYNYTLVDHFNITIKKTFHDKIDYTTIDLLKSKFKQVQEAYDKVKSDDRINFLPMNYIIYKLVQHIGRSDLLDQITLTQNYTSLMRYEEIWQKICYNLDWGCIQMV